MKIQDNYIIKNRKVAAIYSEKNSFFKNLNNKKIQKKQGIFFIEGFRATKQAILNGHRLNKIILKESFVYKYIDLLGSFELEKTVILSDKLFLKLSDTSTTQGIIGVFESVINSQEDIKTNLSKLNASKSNILVLDSVQDPGNIGTILRSADAFEFDIVFCSKGCADVYSQKTIRSSMGSILNLKIYTNLDIKDIIDIAISQKYNIYLSDVKEGQNIRLLPNLNCNIFPICLVIGSEANGINKVWYSTSHTKIHIPTRKSIESLNVAIASSILMEHIYEIKKDLVI